MSKVTRQEVAEPGFLRGNSGSREHKLFPAGFAQRFPGDGDLSLRALSELGTNLRKPSESPLASFSVSLLWLLTSSRPDAVSEACSGGVGFPLLGPWGLQVSHSQEANIREVGPGS